MAVTVGNYITEVASQLSDQANARWTLADQVRYLNSALTVIGAYRPDAFTSTIAITMIPGTQQSLPTGVSSLKSVDYNGPTANCVGSPITEADLNYMRAFFKQPCSSTGGSDNYRVKTYAYDPRIPKTFYVSPPVPDGVVNLQVTATVILDAPQYTTGQLATTVAIDPKYHAAIVHWMLRCAWEVDTESVTSRQNKLDAEKIFWAELGFEYKQNSKYNSGYYLGQLGTKDPQVGTR